MAVFPVSTAPAARSAAVTWSSVSGTLSVNAAEPSVWRTPATMFRSLIGMGTPVSGGSACGSSARATIFSAAAACSAARSAVIVKNAPTAAFSRSVRSR